MARPGPQSGLEKETMEKLTFSVHAVIEPDQADKYRLACDDGRSFLIGKMPEVYAAFDALHELVANGTHAGEIAADDPRFAEWLTVRQAAELSGFAYSTVRAAFAKGQIKGAIRGPWRCAKAALMAWMRDERTHKRGRRFKEDR